MRIAYSIYMIFELWEHAENQSYVQDFIESQDKNTAAKLLVKISDLEPFPLGALIKVRKVVKLHLENFDLYEIRLRCNRSYYRFLFVIRNGTAYLLEAFKKKSDETPPRYIETAILRSKTLDYQLSQ